VNEGLPEGWCLAPLSEVVTFNPGIDKSLFVADDELPFVPMPAVEAETGAIDVSARRPFSKVKSGFTAFATGDVLFAKITPCMENGKMAVVPSLPQGVGFGTTEFHVLRPSNAILAAYVYYFVSSSALRHDAQHHMTGAVGQKRVPKRYLEAKEVMVPPLNEQQRIVENDRDPVCAVGQGGRGGAGGPEAPETLPPIYPQVRRHWRAYRFWMFRLAAIGVGSATL
jgi:type I restriction enzyme S subunit